MQRSAEDIYFCWGAQHGLCEKNVIEDCTYGADVWSQRFGSHFQDSVYHVLPMVNSNHLELIEPMLEWFLEVLPIARETARRVFWLKGARYIWHGGPGMLTYLSRTSLR